jgi:hypothetical protein
VTPKTRAEIGKANARKGKDTELKVAAYLRNNGWPDAERAGRTGWRPRGGDRASTDPGDTRGTDRLVFQIKATSTMSNLKIRKALADTATQAVDADYGILVQRRDGTTAVGLWWAWLPVRDLCALTSGSEKFLARDGCLDAPVRIELGALVALLHAAGYGDAPEASDDT